MKCRVSSTRLCTILLGLLFVCGSIGLSAQTIIPADVGVNVASAVVQLGPWSRLIKDPDGKMTAEQVLAHPAPIAGARGKTLTSFFFTDAAYWFVIPLVNPKPQALNRLLVFEPTWLDDVAVTLAEPDGSLRVYHGGDRLDFTQRSISHAKINVELTLPPGNSQLLVRVKTRDPFVVGMGLWERSAFFKADSAEAMYIGLIYGVLGAMLLYNLVLFLSVRETVYAAYVAYVFFFILMHATYNGHMYHLFWPHSPVWGNWAHSIFIYLFISAGLYFAINFLELRTKLLRAYRWAVGMLLAFIASFILTALFGGYHLHVTSAIIWIIIYAPFSLLLGVLSLVAGNRAARYFLPATAAGFLGSAITALAVSGLIPFSSLTYRAADIGMVIDAILLSIALADRLKLARADTERARAELLETTRLHAQQLEEEVSQRTLELREANATKDKFFSIIAHDLRGPIGSLALFYNDIVQSTRDFTDEILMLTRMTTNTTSNLLEQLLTWARSQRGEIDCNPEPLDISQLFSEMQALFSAQAQAKGVQLKLKMDSPCWVYVDRAMAHTILRNLIHNALKYTSKGGLVQVSLLSEADYFQFRITDTGTGMDTELMQTLFRLDEKPQPIPGTQNELGTGLGLILCSEFVKRNGGTIGAESETGKGSTFWFTLPKAKTQQNTNLGPAYKCHRPLRILVADDSPISRETSGKILQDLGHTVSFALDGEAAVQLARESDFDLILMDIDMPTLNGIEASRRIRANGSSSRIVAWSSYSRKEIGQLVDDIQFDGYLDKPLDKDALLSLLAHLFSDTLHSQHKPL